MGVAGTVEIDFAAETAKFRAEVKAMRGELNSLRKDVGGVGATLKSFGTTLKGLAIGSTIIAGLKAAVAASAQAEASFAQLSAAVKSTGGAAGFTVPQLQKMAVTAQSLTTFSNEAVESMQSILLTFTKIRGPEFEGAQQAILDIAARMGTDLKGAAVQVGKALNDPIKGVSALGEVGVSFTAKQKALITQLVNTGQVAAAQTEILKELNVEFGGAAEAARNNFSGALAGVKNSLTDLLQARGGLPQATDNLNEMARLLQDPGVKAGADAIFSTLIRGASLAGELLGKTAAGLAILAGKGADEVVNIDLQLQQLEHRRKSILSSFGGDESRLTDSFRKELSRVNREMDELLRKQRQLLQIGEFSPKRPLAQGGHGAIRLPDAAFATKTETDEERSARITRELAFEKALLAQGLQNIQQLEAESDRILSEIVEKRKPIEEAFQAQQRKFADQELGALVADIDRKVELERQLTDAKAEETRKRAELDRQHYELGKQVRQDTLTHALTIGATLIAGTKNQQKALELANKAFTIRQIIIDTKAAAARALKYFGPTPVGYAAAAAAIAFGALQVRGVLASSSSFDAGAGATAGVSSSTTAPAPEQTVAPESQKAITVYVNGVVTKEIVDQLVDGLKDADRRGVVIFNSRGNQAAEIRRAA